MKATIKDVARLAGVSIATVSRVINDVPGIKPANRERVLAAIRELSFQPNQMAQNLKSDVTMTIGIIVSDSSDRFFITVIKSIMKTADSLGYAVLIMDTEGDAEIERRCIRAVVDRRVDGLVISPTGFNDDYLQAIKKDGTAVVLFDRRSKLKGFDMVYVDKMNAAYQLTSELITNGHRRIALAVGPKNLITNFDRFTGYIQAFYDANLPVDNDLILYGTFVEEFGREALNKVLQMPQPPTAIISGSTVITKGILVEAQNLHIRIPADLSLVSYGNIEMSSLIQPALTYVDSHNLDVGQLAAKLLFERIQHPDREPKVIELESELHRGSSIARIGQAGG